MPSIYNPITARYQEVDDEVAALFGDQSAYAPAFDPAPAPEEALLAFLQRPDAFEAQPVQDEVRWADYGKDIMRGFADVAVGAGWLINKLDGRMGVGEAIQNLGTDAVDYWTDSLSEPYKQEVAKQFIVKTEDGYEWGDPSLTTALGMGARSLGSTAAGAGIGAGITKVLQVFGNPIGRGVLVNSVKAGTEAAKKLPAVTGAVERAALQATIKTGTQAAKKLRVVDRVLGATGFGIGEGTVGGAMTGVNVESEVMKLPDERLLSSERGRQVYDSTAGLMDESKRMDYVRTTLAKEASSVAGFQAGLTTAILGAPMGAYFGPLFSKVATGRPGSILKGAAGEAAQEFGQSGTEQLIGNLRMAEVGADVGAWENVLNAAVGGAIAGAPLGGVMATAGPTDRQVADAEKRPKLVVDGVNYTRLAEMAAEAKAAGARDEEILPIMNEARKPRQLAPGIAELRRLRDRKLAEAAEASEIPEAEAAGRTVRPSEKAEAEPPVTPEREEAATTEPREIPEGPVTTPEELEAVAQDAATAPMNDRAEPTEAQIEAGNYRKPRVKVAHLPEIRIENPMGSKRTGKRPDGSQWERELKGVHYGYFTRTAGADNEEDGTPREGVDVFVGPNATDPALPAFVIDQKNPDGTFDEGKVMVGFATEDEARQAYLAQYDEGWQGLGAITKMSAEELRAFVSDPERMSRPVAYQPKEVTPDGEEEAQAATEAADVLEEPADTSPEGIAKQLREAKAGDAELLPRTDDPTALIKSAEDALRNQGFVEIPFGKSTMFVNPNTGVTAFARSQGKGAGPIVQFGTATEEQIAEASPEESPEEPEQAPEPEAAETPTETPEEPEPAPAKSPADERTAELAAYLRSQRDRSADTARQRSGRPLTRMQREAFLAGFDQRVAEIEGSEPPPHDSRNDKGVRRTSYERGQRAVGFYVGQYQQRRGATPSEPVPTTSPDAGAVPEDQPASAARIEDFGEKIEGARKDTFTGFRDALKEDIDVAAEPLSKSFPKPDYEKLAEGGVSNRVLAHIAVMRDMIPNKPRKGWKVRRWAEQVATLRDFSQRLLSGEIDIAEFERLQHDSASLRNLPLSVAALEDVAPADLPKAAKYRVASGSFSYLNGQRHSPSKTFWFVEGPKRRTVRNPFSNDPAMPYTHQETPEDAVALAKRIIARDLTSTQTKPARSKYTTVNVYRDRTTRETFLGFKVRSTVIRLKAGFDDAAAARAYLEENRDDIQATIDEMRKGPNMRGTENRPRSGAALREGDVTPEMFSDTFGFRGVQFGNYVEGPRRQADLNRAYDALMDLADVLDVPPRALSLNSSLGLAFGARGRGGRNAAAAHYESGQIVINLTKGGGPGSLAHEWLHALDNYFARQDEAGGYMSERQRDAGPVRDEVYQAWKQVEAALQTGSFAERSVEFDKARSKPYWNTTIEKAARAFERYIVDRLSEKGAINDYLANIDTDGGAYPTHEEMQTLGIRAAFDTLFETIETRGENQALYTRSGAAMGLYSVLTRAAEGLKQERGQPAQMLAMLKKQPGVKAEELEWTGLEEYLSALQGPVTKEQIVEYLANNGVQVEEVKLAGAVPDEDYRPDFTWTEFDPDEDGNQRFGVVADLEQYSFEVTIDDDAGQVTVLADDTGEFLPTDTVPIEDPQQRAAEVMTDYVLQRVTREQSDIADSDGPPKFEAHTLPGGANYREVLLTLPPHLRGNVRPTPTASAPFMERWNELKAKFEEANQAILRWQQQKVRDIRTRDELEGRRFNIEEQMDALHAQMVDATIAEPGGRRLVQPQPSPHFDQDNVLAHVRLKDRTGPNGEKILFIEELQSDWHQRGRRYGYRVPEPTLQDAKEFFGITDADWSAMSDEQRVSYLEEMQSDEPHIRSGKREQVPDAPFKGNAWAELAIKRVVRMASEGGYDQVAWTTGEQQADRYDLSKQVRSIDWTGSRDGVKTVSISPTDGNDIEFRVSPDGTTASISGGLAGNEFAGKKLEAIVGKDVADKIMGDRDGSLSGSGLKIGGEGMKSFYDRTLPNLFKKVARKLDKSASVGKANLTLDSYTVPGRSAPVTTSGDVHALPVTDKMREAAMGGLPLFRKGKGPGLSAARIERQLAPAIGAVSPLLTVRVVQSVDELPGNAQPDDIEGAYFNRGAVYLVADNLSEARIEEVFRHEVFGHAAMERHPEFAQWVRQIQNARRIKGSTIQKLAAEVASRQGVLDPVTEAKEIIALMAERGIEHSLMDKIIAAFRKFFRSIGMLRDVSEAEIRSWLAKGARRFMADAEFAARVGESTDAAMPTAINAADPDDTIDKALFSRAASADVEAAMDPPRSDTQLHRFLDEAIFRFQDKFNYLHKAQKAAARERGIDQLPEAEDVYLAELRYHGMAGAAIEDFQREHVEPLVEAISKSGLTVEDVDRYLHARHAPEANAQLQRINPDREDNEALSGMADAAAAAVIDGFRDAGKLAELEAIAMHVDAITKAQRDLMVESGLESAETIQTWEETYEHYVPLHREGVDKARSKGFSVTGRQKRRAGSKRPVAHIVAQVVAQQEATIIRAQKNKVAQAMLEFATNNPNPHLYEVDKVEFQPSFGAAGLVTYRPQRGFQFADNVLVAKVDGDDHTVTFNPRNHQSQRIGHAMKGLGSDHSGPILNALTKVMRYLALVNTGANPEFILSNFPRDLQTALYNISDTEADKLKWKIVKDVGKAWRGIRAFQEGKHHAWAGHFDEFRKAGAQTGWLGLYSDVAQREGALVKRIEELSGESSLLKIKTGMRAVVDFIERENTAVENAIRLSAFVHGRRAGMSEGQAARLAKELTVNFNRKGDYGQVMNALYLFYNASIQGSARIILAASRSRKVRLMIGATVVAAMFLDMLNRALAGDDEDDKNRYDKIPDYVKERNLIIMRPGGGGDAIKIPLPWGYNVFHVLGQVMGEALTKRNFKPTEGAFRVADAIFSAFNPIGGEGSIAQKISPTITDPIVQWSENKDWAGRPLRPEGNPFDVDKPDSQQYWNSVREPSRWITEQLNELTGGSKVRPGAIDISPELIDLLIDSFTGGAGRFVSDSLSTPVKAIQGEDIESYEIPLLRKLYARPGMGTMFQDYYRNADAVRITEKEARHFMETRDRSALENLRRERSGEYALIAMRRKTDNALRKLRQHRNKVEASQLPAATKRAQLDEINRRMELLMNRFNRLYNQRVGE